MPPAEDPCLPLGALELLSRRALGSLTTVRPDGSPHVVPVGFTYEPSDATVRIITSESTQKVRNLEFSGFASVCQIEGPHWISLEGQGIIARDAPSIADACERYAARYQTPRDNPHRVVIMFRVTRVLGRFPDAFVPA